LNTFVRLSKAGHYKRAEEFYHLYLEKHAGDFAVAAQYAENLIEQGAFGSAGEFLTVWKSNMPDYDSVSVYDPDPNHKPLRRKRDELRRYRRLVYKSDSDSDLDLDPDSDSDSDLARPRPRQRLRQKGKGKDKHEHEHEHEQAIVVHLLLLNAGIYTGLKEQEAARAAVRYLRRVDNVFITEDMSPLRVSDQSDN